MVRQQMLSKSLACICASVIGCVLAIASLGVAQEKEPTKTENPVPKTQPTKPDIRTPKELENHVGHDHSGHNYNHAGNRARSPRTVTKIEPPTGPHPDIVFETPVFDFGRAKAGVSVKHDFIFKNTGTATLRIERVKANCGCTVAGTFDKVVEPGKTGKIPVTFDTNRFKGKIKKPLSVFTNVYGKEQVTFSIGGEIWRPIVMAPGSAAFGSANSQKEQTKVITITSNLDEALELSDVKCESEYFSAELEIVEPGKIFRLNVKTVPPLSNRFNRTVITMRTNQTDIPMLEIMASAYVPPPVLVTPTMLRFPTPIKQDMKRYVYVRSSGHKKMTLSDIKVSDEKLSIKVINDKPDGEAYRLIVTAPKGYVLPETGVDVTFKTDIPNFPNATVPLRPLPKRVRPAIRNRNTAGTAKQYLHAGKGQKVGVSPLIPVTNGNRANANRTQAKAGNRKGKNQGKKKRNLLEIVKKKKLKQFQHAEKKKSEQEAKENENGTKKEKD